MDAASLLTNRSWLEDFLTLLLSGLVVLLAVKVFGNLHYFIDIFKKFWVNSERRNYDSKKMKETLYDIQCKYGLTGHGTLPECCLDKLPKYYSEWEELIMKLPELNRSDKLKDAILNMRLLSCDKLETEAMLRRAYILLGMLVHSYVNGGNAAWDKLKGENDVGVGERETGKRDGCVCSEETLMEKEKLSSRICESMDGNCKQKGKNYNMEKGPDSSSSGVDMSCSIPYVPYQLAIPWFIVCQKLDLPLILTAALDLWNWKLKDSTRPHELSNLTSMMTMSQTETEINFHMVPCAMHYVAGPIMPQVFNLYGDIARVNLDNCREVDVGENVLSFITNLTSVYIQLKDILKRVIDLVDVEIFYDVYRPLLNGFCPSGVLFQLVCDDYDDDDNDLSCIAESFPIMSCIPENVRDCRSGLDCEEKVGVMDDMDAKRTPMLDFLACNKTAFDSVIKQRLPNKGVIANPKGPSAGQSTMVFLFDLVLGIKHKGSGKEFQNEMANYVPVPHRQMIFDLRDLVERYGTLRDFVIQSSGMPFYGQCVTAYNKCIRAVADFRSLHLGIAVKYLVRTKKGTGASSFRDMLNEMTSSTKQVLIQA